MPPLTPSPRSRSGVRGVYPYRGKWRGGFSYRGKWLWVPGKFDTKEAAFVARKEAKARLARYNLTHFRGSVTPTNSGEKLT
jgi:hypothetical protein